MIIFDSPDARADASDVSRLAGAGVPAEHLTGGVLADPAATGRPAAVS
jgi:hypothetical protein